MSITWQATALLYTDMLVTNLYLDIPLHLDYEFLVYTNYCKYKNCSLKLKFQPSYLVTWEGWNSAYCLTWLAYNIQMNWLETANK